MTAQLVSTECVYWPGNSPRCRCCWCCFCPGCNYELCWFDALIWTTSISLLIGHRTVWTGHSSTGRPCNVSIYTASPLSCSWAICTYIDISNLSIFLSSQNINHAKNMFYLAKKCHLIFHLLINITEIRRKCSSWFFSPTAYHFKILMSLF